MMNDMIYNITNPDYLRGLLGTLDYDYVRTYYTDIYTSKYDKKVVEDDKIILKYYLTGAEYEDIDIIITNEWLKIKYKLEGNGYTINEYIGEFKPVRDKTTSNYRNGILSIFLYKREDTLPYKVEIAKQ